MSFLKIENQFEILVRQAIAQRVLDLEERRDKNRAIMIANQVGEMLNGKN